MKRISRNIQWEIFPGGLVKYEECWPIRSKKLTKTVVKERMVCRVQQ